MYFLKMLPNNWNIHSLKHISDTLTCHNIIKSRDFKIKRARPKVHSNMEVENKSHQYIIIPNK